MKAYIAGCLIFFCNLLIAQSIIRADHLESTSSEVNTFSFDSRMHRNPYRTYKSLIKSDTLSSHLLVHLYQGYPILYYSDSAFLDIPSNESYRSNYRLDLQIKPLYYAEYGDFREPFRTQLAIAPKVQLNVFRGFYGIFQWIFPFQNDFKERLGFQSRPGEIGVGHTYINKGLNFFNNYIGTFLNSRYGAYSEYIRMTRSGRMYFGGAVYYTGKFAFDDGALFADPVDYLSGYIHATYRFSSHDLSVRVLLERYLRNDTGGSVELFRQFGNTDIGFFASKSRNGDNAGFYVVFALWPRKFYSNKWLQVRPPHSFKLNYNLRPNTGIAENTRPFTNFYYEMIRFNPRFIENQLQK